MLPKHHIIYGFLFSVLLNFTIFPGLNLIGFALIFLSSILIDVDHYLVYVYRTKDLSVKRAYSYFVDMSKRLYHSKKLVAPTMIFHTVEFLAILIVLAFYDSYFVFIITGILFHWALDIYHMYETGTLHTRSYSLIHELTLRRNLPRV